MSHHQNEKTVSAQTKAVTVKGQALTAFKSAQDGFTLVELAISIFIIGILLGGVLYSEELYRIVQVRRVMSDINSVSAATKGFQEKYGTVPGDFALATTRIPNCTLAVSNCYSGDGNGFVGQVYGPGSSGWDQDQARNVNLPEVETTMFFKHLALGNFIKGVNPNSNPSQPQWGVTHPESSVGGGFTVFADTHSAGSSISIRLQSRVYYGGMPGVDANNERPFTVKQTMYMDTKYDDGRAMGGEMRGIPYNHPNYFPACRKIMPIGREEYNTDPADGVLDSKVCQFHYIFH